MRIRWKLLIALLIITLVPLGLVSSLANRSLQRLARQLGSHVRESQIERAGRQLTRLTDDYSTLVRREKETLEMVLRVQAREAERCLAQQPPADAEVFWAEDYDAGEHVPAGMICSQEYTRPTDDDAVAFVPITYEQQVFKRAPNTLREDIADDVARLTRMLPTYKLLGQGHPNLIHWHYTALASGVHASYPGHGGYPPDFDPRLRSWYRDALRTGQPTWIRPMVDASTRQVMVTLSMPIQAPDGTMAGVTAMDIRLLKLIRSVSVPGVWSADAKPMLVVPFDRPGFDGPGILIGAQHSYARSTKGWNEPIELEWLESEDEAQLQRMVEDIRTRRPGLRKMPYKQRECLWAYSPADEERTCIVLIIPYEEIIRDAVAAEAYVLERVRQHRQTAGIALGVVALAMVVLALLGSRTVTRHVAELASTARRIAHGDLEARARVQSRDEFGQLARTVNEMIPQLAERMRLRESLSLAKQVQQRLLPVEPPKIDGLDIAGHSIYCDQTGGDYYDFLAMHELDLHHVGIAVGDVTGHGIAAALLMATGRALLRGGMHDASDLAAVIDDVNRQLTADTDGARFMTLIYVLVDIQSRALRWVCAGHDEPITYDLATHEFATLPGGGIPVGISTEWQYEEHHGTLSPHGQVIVIGTDGIWEAHDPRGEMFGKNALREVIRKSATRTAEDILRAITDAVTAHRAEAPQEDDITLVVIKTQPENRT